jgi:hypothetical protein
MTNREFLTALLAASTLGEALTAVDEFFASTAGARYVPVGDLENNRGPMEVSADPGRALVERVTNGFDAVLELEHRLHGARPDCRSPREAAIAWLGVPEGGLSKMTPHQRQVLANRVTLALRPGDGKNARIVDIRDHGTGLTAEEMPKTILSLNANNKMTKHYLAGAYGQGGSSTYIACDLTLIACRAQNGDDIAFTIVKYQDLPAEIYKTGHYVYMVVDEQIPITNAKGLDFAAGTLVRHFGYKLESYAASFGAGSVYGLLQQTLFDPVMPIWLDNQVHDWRRVIKGSRNALNGAVDDGDSRGPTLDHFLPMLYVPMDEFGQIGIEYWVLEKPEKANKRPTAAFVNPARPVLLTLNGQAQAELSSTLVRKDAELPYLTQRLIVHVDCNRLSADARRQLFVSNRETARSGALLQMIQKEVIDLLRTDDELVRLNAEARNATMKERDEEAILDARKQVAKLLKLQGIDFADIPVAAAAKEGKGEADRSSRPRVPRPAPAPIEWHEPPTYIRIVWPKDEALTFYPEQRKYLRIETDAQSKYHDPTNPQQSRINLIVSGDSILGFRTTSALSGGRMRALCECLTSAKVGASGTLRVELSVPGRPTLSDEREFQIIAPPPPKEEEKSKMPLPQFDFQPVSYGDEAWTALGWPDDVDTIASSAANVQGIHVVHYSVEFPPFKKRREALERRSPALAKTFETRYRIFLVVHSLLYQEQQPKAQAESENAADDAKQEETERAERVRVATLSAIYAAREVQLTETSPAPELEEV